MGFYERFADVYDAFMRDVPYDEWVDNIEQIWVAYGSRPRRVLELGCGTGNMTGRFAARGYDMIGLDISCDMLTCAYEKNTVADRRILFLHQDMRVFELHDTVDACISVFDCINYILEYDELTEMCMRVRKFLSPGGIFIFDINTEKKYARLSEEGAYGIVLEDSACIWDNVYDAEQRLNECAVHFFVSENGGAAYRRNIEYHYNRAHSVPEVAGIVKKSGLSFIGAKDAETMSDCDETSERIYIICANS